MTALFTIPITKPNGGTMPGWNVNIKHEREQSLFWHWVWSEMGKPYNGVVYDLMKRSWHTYHYSVRRVKKNKINIQKQRLADSLYDNTNFWKNVSYLNQASKSLPDVVDKASGCKQVLDVF